MRTAAQLVAAIKHAVGALPTSDDTRIDYYNVLNMAGRELTMCEDWWWRTSEPIELAGVASQKWVDLPADFNRLLTINPTANTQRCQIKTLGEIERFRNLPYQYTALMWFVCPATAKQPTTGTQRQKPRLEVYPTPTTDGTPTFRVIYDRRWAELEEDDPNALPVVPDEFELALLYKGRALAMALINQSDTIERSLYDEQVQILRAENAKRAINYGRMRGGAGRHEIGFVDMTVTTVNWS